MAAYPVIFNLQDDSSSSSAERVSTLAPLPQQKRPDLLIILEEPTRHIRFLWGIEKLPFSYANRTALNGHIVDFFCDIIAGDTPPTISIRDEWRDLKERPVPSQHTVESKVTKLRPEDHSIPGRRQGQRDHAYCSPTSRHSP